MEHQDSTRLELLEELVALRERVAELEQAETQAEQVEERLRLSEQRQEAVLDTIPDLVWLTDTEGNLLAVNAAWCRFFGLDAQTAVGTARFQVPTCESARACLADDAEVMRSGSPLRQEQLLTDKDGRRCWFETIKSRLSTSRGQILGTAGIARDITERKVAEEELRKNQVLLSEAERLSRTGAAAWDFATDTWTFSEEWRRIHGCGDRTLTTASLLPIAHPDDRRAIAQALEDAKRVVAPYHVRHRILRQDTGEVRIVQAHGEIVRDAQGQPLKLYAVAQDVTEQEQSHEALRRSEERYRRIVETAAEGIWVVDHEWRTAFVNARMAQLLGYTSEELRGRSLFEFLDPEQVPWAQQKLTDRVLGTSPSHDFRFVGREGVESWALVTANSFTDDSGGFAGALAMVTDITERKRTEADLAKAKEAAETANRAKSEFLANMSHEIRTPMTVILGFSDLLLRPNRTVEEQREFLQVIRSNGAALLELLDDILDLSRIEAEKLTVEKAACSLQEALDDILSVARLRATAKRLALKVVRTTGLPEVIHTDRGRLRQILLNLVGNAIKFTEQGEVWLTLQYLPGGAGIGRMQFAVSDTGIGIPADQLGRLFQPFTQVDGTLTRRYGGTGLGLAISKRLAQALGGDIEVTSIHGQGSTFTLTIDAGLLTDAGLPSASWTMPVAEAFLAEEQDPAGRARVLLAEDVPGIQLLVLHMARMINVEIEMADTGQRACELAEQSQAEGRPYDLILMDIQMPQMDGFEATRWLRGRGWTGPIVALTAHAMVGDRERCLNAGCTDYISKPISTTKLWEVLTRYSPPVSSVVAPTCTAPRPQQELSGDLVDGGPEGRVRIRAGSGVYFESSDFCAEDKKPE